MAVGLEDLFFTQEGEESMRVTSVQIYHLLQVFLLEHFVFQYIPSVKKLCEKLGGPHVNTLNRTPMSPRIEAAMIDLML